VLANISFKKDAKCIKNFKNPYRALKYRSFLFFLKNMALVFEKKNLNSKQFWESFAKKCRPVRLDR
jgi:hypothetical protein